MAARGCEAFDLPSKFIAVYTMAINHLESLQQPIPSNPLAALPFIFHHGFLQLSPPPSPPSSNPTVVNPPRRVSINSPPLLIPLFPPGFSSRLYWRSVNLCIIRGRDKSASHRFQPRDEIINQPTLPSTQRERERERIPMQDSRNSSEIYETRSFHELSARQCLLLIASRVRNRVRFHESNSIIPLILPQADRWEFRGWRSARGWLRLVYRCFQDGGGIRMRGGER